MGKRPRGKQAEALRKRAKAIKDSESALQNSAFGNLDSDVEDAPDYNDSDQEQDYESLPRAFKEDDEEIIERLPVKTADGKLKRVVQKKKIVKKEEPESESESSEEEEEDTEENARKAEEDSDVDEVVDKRAEKIKLNETKERIAELADLLAENPEENIGKLREIRELMQNTKLLKVKRLTVLALVQIFKDLIPGYRIAPLTDAQQKEKTSKDVKKLRTFEQTLLANYKEYVGTLRKYAKRGKGAEEGTPRYQLGVAAWTATCELLEAVPHFNFLQDLIGILVEKVSIKHVDKSFERCVQTIEHVFKEDDEGQISFELVKLMTKMIKARHYKVDPALLSTFLHLRLLTELVGRADLDRVIKEKPDAPKIKKKDRIPLSKKERKNRRERKEIEEEMRIAETAVSAEERERLQGQTLKLVFILYFNILKERVSSLMGDTLEGLAKFAHLINADFFGDLLEVLRELIIERQRRVVEGKTEFKESETREALLCVVTAFALLSGQSGESMNLDLSFFINHFYTILRALALNPEIEFSHRSLRLDDPLNPDKFRKAKVNISTETEMMVRSFEAIFFRQKGVGKIRVEAFAKRLATTMIHLPEKSAIASLRILDKMNKKYAVVNSMYYTDDRVGNGRYVPDADEPEQSNPEASTIWELALLDKHYDTKISKAARTVMKTLDTYRKAK